MWAGGLFFYRSPGFYKPSCLTEYYFRADFPCIFTHKIKSSASFSRRFAFKNA